MRTRPWPALLALVLIASGCGTAAPPTSSPQTSATPTSGLPTSGPTSEPTAGQPTDGQPATSPTTDPSGPQPSQVGPQPSIPGQPGLEDLYELTPEDLNPPIAPLPEPRLTTVDEVTESIFALGAEDQIIVSMLDLLGVGIYREDGTAIREGTEQSDADFYMFEPEVYGLIEMLGEGEDGQTWITFGEFHSIVSDFGFTGTPEDLIAIYSDAYAAQPDAAMTKFVQAQAFLELEAQIPPLGVWLLFVDGLVAPHGTPPVASVGSDWPAIAQPANLGGIGIAFPGLQPYIDSLPTRADYVARMSAMLRGAFMTIAASPTSVHEGHGGGGGETSTITATVHRYAPTSPFSSQPMAVCSGTLDGLPVNFTWDAKLTAHGTPDLGNRGGITDVNGQAVLNFHPKPEKTLRPEDGWVVRDVATITASANKGEMIQSMCPGAPPGAERLARGNRGDISKRVRLEIKWHVPRAMRILLTNEYELFFLDVFEGDAESAGKDTYDGVLVEQDDGSWTGAVFAIAKGQGAGMFFGLPGECAPDWNASQVLEVFAEREPIPLPGEDPLNPTGDFHLTFYPLTPPRPAFNTSLCPALNRHGARYDYVPLNDARVWNTDVGLGLEFPPGDLEFDTYTIPDTANVLVDADWKVVLTMLKPPPLP